MILEDVLKDVSCDIEIEVRCNSPVPEAGEDMLMGFCKWNGNEQVLESLDGDDYSLKDEIYDFAFDKEGSMTIWVQVDWITGEEWNNTISEYRKEKKENSELTPREFLQKNNL